MNDHMIRKACHALNMAEPISIEPDGTVWTGSDDDRDYPDMKPILKKAKDLTTAAEKARASALAKLAELGLTEAEVAALLA